MPPRRGARRKGGIQRPRNQPQSNNMEENVENNHEYFNETQEDIKPDVDAVNENLLNENIEPLKTLPDETEETELKTEIKTEIKNEVETDITTETKIELKTDIETEMKSDSLNMSDLKTNEENQEKIEEKENETNASVDHPYKVKVSHLPANYCLSEFLKFVKNTFRLQIDKIISPATNSPWLLIACATKEEQEKLVRLLHNHMWKKKVLRAIAFYAQKRSADDDEDPESKKLKTDDIPVLTLEEEILSESLPLYNVPYEEQNRLTIVDVEILSNKLHAFMCVRNPALAGWAEAMCEKNNGSIFKIEPLKASPLLQGYRNKCKFRIGKNSEGETTVGFCLNDNENKILGVQPGDKLIHLPDSMKYAAKKFEEFIRASGKEPYDKKQKSGFWDHIIIRLTPNGTLMLVVIVYHNQQTDEKIAEIKNEIKEYFVNGDGKDCNLCSLYFQIMNDKAPVLPPEKLELLHGDTHFYENICGLKFYVGPFSILNVNSSSSENIYKSIAELAEPTQETTIIDLCSGTGGVAFTIASKCKNVIAIESHEDHIKDALKTKEINNIENVELIKGKVEDELAKIFEKLGDANVIPIIDPPRQGLVQKAISQLRANENIKRLVYVCSNSKMGAKNFLDLCASAEKKEGTFGNPLNVIFAGLPFLPIKAIPIDVAPYTVNNTIIILFERIDPTTFPPAKNPPPVPIKRPQTRKDEEKKKKYVYRRSWRGRSNGRRFRSSNSGSRSLSASERRLGRSGRIGQFSRRNPISSGSNSSNRFPPPLLRPLDPALSLVAKYERRIAELEQQDRAFKAGLTMGLQALGTRGGPGTGVGVNVGVGGGGGNFNSFGNNFDTNLNNKNFGGFRNQYQRDRSPWQSSSGSRSGPGNRNFGSMGGNGGYGGGNNYGNAIGGLGGGYNSGAFNNYDNRIGFGNCFGGIGGGGNGGGGVGHNYHSGYGGGGGGIGNSGSGGKLGGGGYRNKYRR